MVVLVGPTKNQFDGQVRSRPRISHVAFLGEQQRQR
jgi:hypothetical protein